MVFHRFFPIAIRILRIGLCLWIGGLLLLASVGKLLDNRHFAAVLAQWQVLPERALLPAGLLISLSELLLAVWLFSGWRLTLAALVAVVFHIVYTAGTAITLLRGIHLRDCGCFGILFQHPLEWPMVRGDFGYALLSALLYVVAKYEKRHMRKGNHNAAQD